MREKYESLALSELREIAKARGLKGISALKKADLIEHMLAADEKDKADGKDVEPKPVLKGIGERPSHERREGGERREFRREKPQQADGEKEFWRLWRTALALSEAKTFCRVRTMSMWRRAKSAALICARVILLREIPALRR